MRVLRLIVGLLLVIWVGAKVGDGMSAAFGERAGGPVGFAVLAAWACAVMLAGRRLRLERPWLWWPLLGAPEVGLRMLWTWRATCEGLGLSVPAKRISRYGLISTGSGNGRRDGGGLIVKGEPLKLIAPHRVGIRVNGCALVVTVKLHPGQTPQEWERAGEAFAHQWRVHRVRAVSNRPGFVTLTGLGFDPLRYPRASKPTKALVTVGPRPQRTDHAVIPGVLVVPVGIEESGGSWDVDLLKRPHHLITGATQSGKSTLTVRFLAELARRPVGLVGIDAKNGMELSPFGPRLSALATSRAEAAAALEALIGVLYLRTMLCREHGARSIWELPMEVRPEPIVVVVDEIAELFLAVDKPGKDEAGRCVTSLVRIGQLGAALGLHLWVAGQRFGSDLGPGATLLRAQLSGRICHRVADTETATMTLAGLPPESITEAQQISTDLRGVAVVGDDSGTWYLARSNPLSVPEAAETASQYAELTIPLPEVTAAIDSVRLNGGGW
jgi:DNA segregation ATPase FtsK/SpoIIIE, S-DNA-T family